MTLFVLEGPSASGKSTVRDRILENKPKWIRWKGENLMRKGPGDHWKEYQRRYHEALHRLYELNPENVIVADRAFSDCVYNSDEEFREEMRRLAACYGDAHVLFFAPFATGEEYEANHGDVGVGSPLRWRDAFDYVKPKLEQRGSRDMPKLHDIWGRYRDLLQMFDHELIDTHDQDVGASAAQAIDYIESNKSGHNPDI